MQLPGTPSLVYLGYLLLFLPWIAFRGARRLRAARDGVAAKPLPSREAIWIGTLVSLSLLLMMAWLAGRGFDYRFFAVHSLGVREGLAAVVALAVCFTL